MNSMFSLKFTILFYFKPVRSPLLVLGCRIIAPLALTASQCNNFSRHKFALLMLPLHPLTSDAMFYQAITSVT